VETLYNRRQDNGKKYPSGQSRSGHFEVSTKTLLGEIGEHKRTCPET
jgi:uncharacterized protein YifE (UPF0438 family)